MNLGIIFMDGQQKNLEDKEDQETYAPKPNAVC